MKKIIFKIILLFAAGLNFAFAQNTMRIDTLSGRPGDTLTFSVKIDNVKPFVAFQLDIQLPAQLSYINNSAALTSRANGHSFAASIINPTLIRVLAYSMIMTPFLGNTGPVLTFKCIAGNVPGTYSLNVVSPIISDSLNANILTASYNGRFTLLLQKIGFNTGSIDFGRTLLGTNANYNLYIYNNGTSNLTVSKLSSISTSIRFLDSSGAVIAPGGNVMRTVRLYADTKGLKTASLKIYSDDPTDTVHTIPAQGTVYTTNELYLNSISLKYGFSGTIKIRLKNFEPVSAFQTSITLPSSVQYNTGSVVLNPLRKDDHVITASVLSGNVLKIISYSPTNKPYLGNDSTIAEFTIRAVGSSGSYGIPITEGIISDTSGVNIMSNVYGGNVSITSPVISLPASIAFDTISYIDTNRKVLAVRNNGNDTLLISGINCANTSFVNETTLPVRIPPSVTSNFTIRFSNPNRGWQTGNLIIYHNDSLRNPGSVPVTGYVYKINKLLVRQSEFNSRDSSYVSFDINNAESIVAFQFDVTLPPQAVFIPNSAVLTSRANGHQVFTSVLPGGDIRVIAFSMTQSPFFGTSGEIVKFKSFINADTGYYPVSVKNVILSDSNNINISSGFTNGFIRVSPRPVTLISPGNNSVGNPLNLNLLWSSSRFASNYHLQAATDSLFSNIVINDSTRTDTTYSLTNLNILQSYFWRVRIKNYSGIYRFSDYYKFRTIGYPTQVVLSSPADNAVDQPLTENFNWFKAIDQTFSPKLVSNYWFELATDSSFASIITRDSTLSDTTKSVSGLSYITKYYWRVKAKNQIGWDGFSVIRRFTTVPPVPLAPSLLLPSDNSTGNPVNLNLVWSKPQYAAGYNVVVSTDPGFSNIVLNDSTLTDSVRALSNLTPLTTYYWKVRAKNISGWGVFSGAYNFKIIGTPTTVVLSMPANNAVNQPVNLVFNWYKAVDQTSGPKAISNYWFEIASDSLFVSVVARDSSLTDTTKSVTGLNYLTSYFWRVKAKNQIGWAAFSSIWKFTTIVPIPGAPVLISPAFNSTGNPLNINLVWTKPANATNYNVILATDTGFTNILLNDSTLTDSVRALTNLSPLTTYYWKVRAKSLSGWSGFSGAFNFKTIGTPTTVVLSEPANNAVNQPVNLLFKWYKAVDQTDNITSGRYENADGPKIISNYWFELSSDSAFTTIVTRDSLLTDTTKSVTSLSNSTNYYWRVKAKNQIGWAAFSAIWKFTTIVSIPAAPVLLSPPNNSTGITLTPSLDWNGVIGATSYRVQVATDSLFAVTVYDTAGVTGNVTIPAGKLTGLTKYYWRVNASNIAGTGNWSAVWKFTTIQNLNLNLKVYLEGFWDGVSHVSDTVMVYLANPTAPFNYADSAKVVLSSTGTAPVNFTKAPNGNYYIVVNHRNHLETWSKLAQVFTTNATVNYDFTTAATQAYGDNMKQVGSSWVLFGGDANRDGSVDAFDVIIVVNEYGTQGYLEADFNGDYDVNAVDITLFVPNFGLTKAIPSLMMRPVMKIRDYDLSRIKKTSNEINSDKKTNKNPIERNNN